MQGKFTLFFLQSSVAEFQAFLHKKLRHESRESLIIYDKDDQTSPGALFNHYRLQQQ